MTNQVDAAARRPRLQEVRMEAALACRLILSGHMPKGSASKMESGIIMVDEMLGTFLIMASR
jgi:hypothetical protein